MSKKWNRRAGAAIVLAAALSATATTVASGSAQANEIVIGATIPETGPLAFFAPSMKAGYQQAMDEYNAKGGVTVDGKKTKLRLVILDNKSDPNLAATQARTLILQNHAVALLGPPTPPLSIPVTTVAEQLRKPIMNSATPIRAWLSGRPSGWHYGWDVFLDEFQLTTTEFQAASLVRTNKRVALFTDTEQDGVVMGGLWEKNAPKYGYKIVARYTFAVGSTDFTSYINDAKKKGVEVLIAQMIPPDAIALWKQMRASNYVPKVAFCEKCSNTSGWWLALHSLAVGTSSVDAGWSPGQRHPRSAFFVNKFAKKLGQPEVSFVVEDYSGAMVLFDAINRANSTDANKINDAIAKTNKTYPVAHVKFAKDHTSPIFCAQTQWRSNGTKVLIWPKSQARAKLVVPPPGLVGR
jgi:branched-chain amino acid transport system substrate-binding protein